MTGKFSKDVMKAGLRGFSLYGEFQKAESSQLINQLCLEGFLKEATWKNGLFAITQKGKDFLNG